MRSAILCIGWKMEKRQGNKRTKEENRKVLLAAGICLLWLAVVRKTLGICFETNDDKFIAEILSGALTGEPESHAVYLNYLLSAPLALLYRITTAVPWYGGMLVLCHFLMYVALLQSVWKRAETRGEYIVLAGLVGCYALANLYMTAAIQYTSTAAMLAAMGYACLLLRKEQKEGLLIFSVFELLAFLLRSQAMLMIQPLGGAVCVFGYLTDREGGIEIKCRRIGRFAIVAGLILLVGFAGQRLGYAGTGWKEYERFNAARTEMFDYYGKPDYDEVKPILDTYGVTQTEYAAFCNYVILDDSINADCAEELAEYAKSRQAVSMDMGTLLKRVWSMDGTAEALKLERCAWVAWLAVILWALVSGSCYLIVPLAGLALGKTAVWGYLIYGGRLPLRVKMPLISCEILLLGVLLARDYVQGEKPKRQKLLALLSGTAFAVFCLSTGKAQYHEVKETSSWQQGYMEGLIEIQEYCREHTDKRYLLDSWSFCYYRGSAFETRIYENGNSAYTGCWYSGSPAMKQYLQAYLGELQEDICLIVSEAAGSGEYYAVQYLTEKTGQEPELADRITVSWGGSYLVWEFGQ